MRARRGRVRGRRFARSQCQVALAEWTAVGNSGHVEINALGPQRTRKLGWETGSDRQVIVNLLGRITRWYRTKVPNPQIDMHAERVKTVS